MWARFSRLTAQRPFSFGVAISTVKTGAADYIAQMYIEERQTLDRTRSAVFLMWGAVYLGGVQYLIYSHLFPRVLFPSAATFVAKPFAERLADRAGQQVVAQQVALDQFLHHPLVLFPCFYIVKEHVELSATPALSVARTGLQKYATNVWDDCLFCWRTWVPAFFVNFSVCPIHMRIPFVAAVSFGFTAFFSIRRGERQPLPDGDDVARSTESPTTSKSQEQLKSQIEGSR